MWRSMGYLCSYHLKPEWAWSSSSSLGQWSFQGATWSPIQGWRKWRQKFSLPPIAAGVWRRERFRHSAEKCFPFTWLGKGSAGMAWRLEIQWRLDLVGFSTSLVWGCQLHHRQASEPIFTGHLRYTKDDPVFLTTLQADLHSLKAEAGRCGHDVEAAESVTTSRSKLTFPVMLPRDVGSVLPNSWLRKQAPRLSVQSERPHLLVRRQSLSGWCVWLGTWRTSATIWPPCILGTWHLRFKTMLLMGACLHLCLNLTSLLSLAWSLSKLAKWRDACPRILQSSAFKTRLWEWQKGV